MLKSLINTAKFRLYMPRKILTQQLKTKIKNTTGMSSMKDSKLVWIDLELTGLNLESDHIMEIGCLVTDENLQPIDDGINIVINQPDSILNGMNEWCVIHHGKSGLTEECRRSNISLAAAQSKVVDYVKIHILDEKYPIAGNSVHEDRRFLLKYMPDLMDKFHYRIVDVSTIKELCRRWYPSESINCPKKKFSHRCMDDIHESISELKYYKQSIFKESS